MKTAINTQSQNEVKDLLNEYVVSPLNTDISTTLSKMEREIEELESTIKSEIEKDFSSVNGRIGRLQGQLDKSFHFEDEEDVFEGIKESVEESQDSIEKKLAAIDRSIKDTASRRSSEIEAEIHTAQDKTSAELAAAQEKIISALTEDFKSVHSTLDNLKKTSETDTAVIREQLVILEQLLRDKSDSLTALCSELIGNLDKRICNDIDAAAEEVRQAKALLDSNDHELRTLCESLAQEVTAYDEQTHTMLTRLSDDIMTEIGKRQSDMQVVIEKRYKTLFTASLAIGGANLLGIIAVIILCILKG